MGDYTALPAGGTHTPTLFYSRTCTIPCNCHSWSVNLTFISFLEIPFKQSWPTIQEPKGLKTRRLMGSGWACNGNIILCLRWLIHMALTPSILSAKHDFNSYFTQGKYAWNYGNSVLLAHTSNVPLKRYKINKVQKHQNNLFCKHLQLQYHPLLITIHR